MSKDLTMDLVRVGQMAAMDPLVEAKLKASAQDYLRTKDYKTKHEAKSQFFKTYKDAYEEAIEGYIDLKQAEAIVVEGQKSNERFEHRFDVAIDIGSEMANMAFIKSTRVIAQVEAIDFSVARNNRDILLEEHAPHLAASRSDRTPTPTPTTPTSTSMGR